MPSDRLEIQPVAEWNGATGCTAFLAEGSGDRREPVPGAVVRRCDYWASLQKETKGTPKED